VSVLDQVIACPNCGSQEIGRQNGEYPCPSCGRRYPVVRDIPRFVDDLQGGLDQIQSVFDFEHRIYEESMYAQFSPKLVDDYLADCELPREFFPGKRALDAGCGSGRWTYALSELGADVVGCDLTDGGLESANAEVGERPNVALAQANIFNLPLRPGAFDFVMSWGVLHHTPDTRKAFESIVPLVKPGGTLYVMIYERHSLLRQAGTGVVRRILQRMSNEKRYRACKHLIIRNRFMWRAIVPFVTVAHYDPATTEVDESTLQFGLFDAYSPKFNHLHSRDEVAGWFRANGFTDVTVLDTPPGTTVKVRGTKAAA
jgi:SAM-dependent methyltransferase